MLAIFFIFFFFCKIDKSLGLSEYSALKICFDLLVYECNNVTSVKYWAVALSCHLTWYNNMKQSQKCEEGNWHFLSSLSSLLLYKCLQYEFSWVVVSSLTINWVNALENKWASTFMPKQEFVIYCLIGKSGILLIHLEVNVLFIILHLSDWFKNEKYVKWRYFSGLESKTLSLRLWIKRRD